MRRPREVAGRLRARREDAGVHLDAGRDAEDRARGSPTTSTMSRVVPSPPAKRIRSTRRRSISRAAARVSSAVVSRSARGRRSTLRLEAVPDGGVAAHRAGRRPRATSSVAVPLEAGERALGPHRRDRLCAELERPRARSRAPSVPLSPTRPPRPGDGIDDQPEPPHPRRPRSELRGDVVGRAPRDRDHLVELGLGDDERRREGDRVRHRQRARDQPELEAARVDARADLERGVEPRRRILAATNSTRGDQARGRAPRRRAGGRRTPRAAGGAGARRVRPPARRGRRARSRRGSRSRRRRERVRRVRVAVPEGAEPALPSTSTLQTCSETRQPESGTYAGGDALGDGRSRSGSIPNTSAPNQLAEPAEAGDHLVADQQHVVLAQHLLDAGPVASRAGRSRRRRPAAARR